QSFWMTTFSVPPRLTGPAEAAGACWAGFASSAGLVPAAGFIASAGLLSAGFGVAGAGAHAWSNGSPAIVIAPSASLLRTCRRSMLSPPRLTSLSRELPGPADSPAPRRIAMIGVRSTTQCHRQPARLPGSDGTSPETCPTYQISSALQTLKAYAPGRDVPPIISRSSPRDFHEHVPLLDRDGERLGRVG